MENTNESQDSPDIAELIRFLQKNNLKKTELCFRREYDSRSNQISSVNVNDYFAVYSCLSNFILNSSYQLELIQCLFPLFVHLYLDLIEYNSTDECQRFYNQFVDSTFESLHREFFSQLKLISHSSKHLYQCSLTNVFRKSRFFLRLSMTSYNELQNFIDSTKSLTNFDLTSSQISLLLSIFQQYIKIDIDQQFFTPSNIVRFQTIEQPMTPIFVHMTVANTIQFTRLYTGMFPLQSSAEQKRDLSSLYPQMNYNRLPNNIDLNNIPRLGPHKLPSICLYSLKNSKQTINCVTLSNDCRLLAVGFQSSEILICSLNPNHKLYSMKSATELHHSNNINILDTKSDLDKTNERLLIGHTGSILALAFEPNKQIYLLSGSQDCTIRLWHLSTWSCLVVYKMHFQCILDVTFASNGHTFASCSIDGLVCLWTIDKISPFRIYPEYGHSGPINLVEFHPNANYLASAHCDHTIHLWNIHHENSLVRIFNGHRHQISSLRFSPNGHFLASGCWNGEIILWDIQNNLQITHLSLHKQAISSIEFNPLTGTLLLVASIDSSISLWNCFMITKLYDEKLADSINSPSSSSSSSSSSNKILLNLFKTKNTSLFHIRFSKENVLYAIGLIGSTNK